MLYKLDQAERFTIPGEIRGLLYPSHPLGAQTIARIHLQGRYPEAGYSLNNYCTETLFMLSGILILTYGLETYSLSAGDLFYILPGKAYSLTGTADCLVFISPQWDSTQNRIVAELYL